MKQYILQIIIVILITIVLIQLTCNKGSDNSKQLLNENKELKSQIDLNSDKIDSLKKILEQKEFNEEVTKNYYVNEQGKIDLISDDSLAKFFDWFINSRRKPGL